jgi:transcriptional regulator with XRE-family HTH domain
VTDSDIARALGSRVRALREAVGLTQERLAHNSGIDRTYVSGIERGARNPSLKTIARLADALGVRVGQLFDAPD